MRSYAKGVVLMEESVVIKLNEQMTIRQLLNRFYLSKTKIHELYMNKSITVNGKTYNFDKQLDAGEEVTINTFEENNLEGFNSDLEVIYEDKNFLVVNKKPAYIIHGESNSLANQVSAYFKKNNVNCVVRYPSRLDTDTSGLMIFPKNFLWASYFDYLFRMHDIKKIYWALVYNRFKELNGFIDSKIGTDRHVNNKMVISKNGKEAYTSYHVLKQNDKIALVEVMIKTGRTHQIRLHLSSINHPLLGDNIYGKSKEKRVMLDCHILEFKHPLNGSIMRFASNIMEDFQTIIDKNFN